MSVFITFEGIEGCGKTTQVRRLADHLQRHGHAVLTTREPGGCPIADEIRRILLSPATGELVPRAERMGMMSRFGDERTMAELDPDEKHAISHRGRAARALAGILRASR